MEGGSASIGRRRLVLALVTAGVVLVALVAAGDRVQIATGSGVGVDRAERPSPAPQEVAEPAPAPRITDPVAIPGAGTLAVVVQSALIVAGVAVLIAGGRAFVRMWPRSDESEERLPAPAPRLRPDEIVEVLDEGLEALADGPVDDVVVACWVRLEHAAAAAGVEPIASETPSELAARVLGDLHAPAPAVERLLVRYRTARFSAHPLDDQDRAVAIESLEEIRAAIVGAHR